MNTAAITFIQFLHLIFILFIIVTPFLNSPYFLLLHVIVIPFMLMHWVIGNNTCVLTLAERYLKGIKESDSTENCYMCRLIYPVFDFSKNRTELRKILYTSAIILWLISVTRLYRKYKSGEISHLMDFFKLGKII